MSGTVGTTESTSELTGLKDRKNPEWLDIDKDVTPTQSDNDQASLRSRTNSGSHSHTTTAMAAKSLLDMHHIIIANNSDNARWIGRYQRLAGILSLLLSYVSLILVCVWVNDGAMGGGGVSWAQGDASRVFNWHPVMMILTFVFMTHASLSFRFHWSKRIYAKLSHVLLWLTAILTASIGIKAVLQSHNDPVSGYIANFYSFHSWMASAVVFFYTMQFLMGASVFGLNFPELTENTKQRLLAIHRFLGRFLYFATGATIMTGIQEKEGFINCSYKVYAKDHVWYREGEIPKVCHLSHTLALFVLLLTLFTTFATYDFTPSSFTTSYDNHNNDKKQPPWVT